MVMRGWHSLLGCGLVLTVASGAVASGSGTGSGSAATPAPVYEETVTSARDLVEDVATTRRIDEEDIRQESARTLDEALVHQPGVVIRTGSDGTPRIDMRGLRTRHVLLLVDGIPMNGTEDGQFDPRLIPTEMIGDVKLSYGNSSVLYGDGPIGGVLQIRTRRGEEGIHGSLTADARQRDQFLGQATVSGATRDLDVFVAGSVFDGHGFTLPDDFETTPLEGGSLRDNSDREQRSTFARVGWMPTEHSKLALQTDYRRGESGVPWSVFDQTDPFSRRPRYERIEHFEGFSSQLSYHWAPEDPLELRSWAYLNRQREVRHRYDDEALDSMLERNSFKQDGTALVAGGALHGRYDLGRFGAVRCAMNGRFERFDASGRIRDLEVTQTVTTTTSSGGGGGGGGGSSTTTTTSNSYDFRPIDEDHHLSAYSAGCESELWPTERSGLVFGYAQSWLDREDGESETGGMFLAGGFLDFDSGTRLRGSVSRRIRFPSIRQLYDIDGGNPDLGLERSYGFEVGVEQELPGEAQLTLTVFDLELRDFIDRESGEPFENHDRLRMRGVEVTASSRPWEPLFMRLGYTFLDARDVGDHSPFDELQSRPRHKVDGEVRYTLPWGTVARAAVSYVAGTFVYTRNEPYRQRRLSNYTLVDLRLTHPLLEGRLNVYAGVDNLLDREWTLNYALPKAGRTIYGGAELRF